MYPGHPWEGEDFGPVEYEWFLARGYIFNVEFDVHIKPFIDFCKAGGHRPQELMMKITYRLSVEFLPQRTMALNGRSYPARYPVGYIRAIEEGRDMLEHIAVREKPGYFVERPIRDLWNPQMQQIAIKFPKLSIWMARHFFPTREVKNNYALMVSRNPLRSLNTRVVFHGTNYRTIVLTVPFGDVATVTFGAPHALGNINYYEPFLKQFKDYMEDPGQIPKELLVKPYKQVLTAQERNRDKK